MQLTNPILEPTELLKDIKPFPQIDFGLQPSLCAQITLYCCMKHVRNQKRKEDLKDIELEKKAANKRNVW